MQKAAATSYVGWASILGTAMLVRYCGPELSRPARLANKVLGAGGAVGLFYQLVRGAGSQRAGPTVSRGQPARAVVADRQALASPPLSQPPVAMVPWQPTDMSAERYREAWKLIAMNAEVRDLGRLSRCARSMRDIAADNSVWAHHFRNTFFTGPVYSQPGGARTAFLSALTCLGDYANRSQLRVSRVVRQRKGLDFLNLNRSNPSFALLYAARLGLSGAVEPIVAAGVDINSRFVEEMRRYYRRMSEVRSVAGEMTVLHVAAVMGHSGMIDELNQAGADIEARNREGITPLIAAAWVGSVKGTRALVGLGAELEAKTPSGSTALHIAVQVWNVGVVEALCKAGADVDGQTDRGNTPLHMLVRSIHSLGRGRKMSGFVRIVKALKGADFEAQNQDGVRPLAALARAGGGEQAVGALVGNGADVNARDHNRWTPLHHAAKWCNAASIEALCSNGANVQGRDAQGRTPLHVVLHKVREFQLPPNPHKAILALCAVGADTLAVDQQGHTPMDTVVLNRPARLPDALETEVIQALTTG